MKKMRKSFTEFFFETFLKSSVSRIVPKNVKGGTLWDFLNVQSVAKYQKTEGMTLCRHLKKLRKKSQSRNYMHEKIGQV